MNKKESDKVMEIMSSYKRKGIEEGREEAIFEVAKRFIELNTPLDVVETATSLSR